MREKKKKKSLKKKTLQFRDGEDTNLLNATMLQSSLCGGRTQWNALKNKAEWEHVLKTLFKARREAEKKKRVVPIRMNLGQGKASLKGMVTAAGEDWY